MGSLGSTTSTTISQETPQTNPNDHQVYVSFCGKEPSRFNNVNISNWISRYTPSNNSWSLVTFIPGLTHNQILKDFAMVAIANFLFVIGGRRSHKQTSKHDPDNESFQETDLEVIPDVWKYDIRTNTWSQCNRMNIPRFQFASAVCNDKIYVAGGMTVLGSAKGTSSAEVYDPALDEWKSLPSMTTMRYKSAGVTVEKGKILVVGGFVARRGCDIQGPFNVDRSSAEMYDIRHDKWEFITRMWDLDVPPNQIVAVSDQLFSCGDCLNVWKGYIEVFDGKLNLWSIVEFEGSNMETLSSPVSTADHENWPPVCTRYLTMAPIENKLYLLAGYRVAGEISRMRSEVHVFDTRVESNGWMSFEPTEEEGEKELCCHSCVVKLET